VNAVRERLVAEVRSWIGTPYHHQADVKTHGVDCGMLLVRVFVDLGLVEPFDPRPYPIQWHLHRDDERYLAFLFDRAHEVERPEPGDIVMFRYGRTYSHGGIVTDVDAVGALKMVHASGPARCVLEEAITGSPFARAPMRCFSYFDKD
jgi:cell wall-associated NlpC family hydrolase